MKRQRIQQIGTLLILGAALAAGASCTGTDFIESGTTQVAFETTSVNPSSQGFECVLLRILTLELRPNDPAAAAVLGDNSLGVVTQNIIVNFSGESCSLFSQVIPSTTLTEGSYRITSFVIGIQSDTEDPAVLFDELSGTRLTCAAFTGDTRDIASSFPDPIIVRAGEPIRIVVDVQELAAVLRPESDFFVCTDFLDDVANIVEIH